MLRSLTTPPSPTRARPRALIGWTMGLRCIFQKRLFHLKWKSVTSMSRFPSPGNSNFQMVQTSSVESTGYSLHMCSYNQSLLKFNIVFNFPHLKTQTISHLLLQSVVRRTSHTSSKSSGEEHSPHIAHMAAFSSHTSLVLEWFEEISIIHVHGRATVPSSTMFLRTALDGMCTLWSLWTWSCTSLWV